MQAKSDAELLREHVAQASEAAFREIVTRHADLVYASALRQVRSPELARDISQGVFADLVRKAPSLGETLAENASLVGWLYRSTRFAAHTQLRNDRRRQARERQAMENFDTSSETATEWEQIGPVLDEAMADLSDEDREALLLRYFKNHDFRAIGVALGVSDDAAQKRVSRALERLRAEFNRRGVSISTVALAAAVSANAVTVGPAGLAAALSTAALTGTTLTATATATATKAIVMTTLQKTVIAVALTAAVGTGIYEARQASQLRDQILTLQQGQTPLSNQIQDLQKEQDETGRQLAALRGENARLSSNASEIFRLRNEIGQLRRERTPEKQLANQQTVPPANAKLQARNSDARYLAKAELANVGYATPLTALQTSTWAMMSGNYDQVTAGLSPELLEKELKDPKNREGFEERRQAAAQGFKGMQILAQKNLSPEKVELKFRQDTESPNNTSTTLREFLIQPMVKVGKEWKIGGSTRDYTERWEQPVQVIEYVP